MRTVANRIFSPTLLNGVRANAAGWRYNELAENTQEPLGLPLGIIGTIGSVAGRYHQPLRQHGHTQAQIAALRRASEMGPAETAIIRQGRLTLMLPPMGLANIEIR